MKTIPVFVKKKSFCVSYFCCIKLYSTIFVNYYQVFYGWIRLFSNIGTESGLRIILIINKTISPADCSAFQVFQGRISGICGEYLAKYQIYCLAYWRIFGIWPNISGSCSGSLSCHHRRKSIRKIFVPFGLILDFNATCIDLDIGDNCMILTGYMALYKVSNTNIE